MKILNLQFMNKQKEINFTFEEFADLVAEFTQDGESRNEVWDFYYWLKGKYGHLFIHN